MMAMTSAGKIKRPADLKDFQLLAEFIRDDKENDIKSLVDSKDFSREAWDRRIRISNFILAPLQIAVQNGRLSIVKCMLQRGLDYYDFYDYIGNPPIIAAVEYGHLEIVRVFVEELGYDVNIFKHGDVHSTYISLVSNPREYKEFHLLDHAKKPKMVKYLIDAGSDVNWVGPEGTVLHRMIKLDNRQLCEVIFSKEFTQIDARNRQGETAFFTALKSSLWSMCEFLTAHGADVNLGTSTYPNLFSYVTRFHDLDTMKYLHKCGADPDVTSPSGQRPIDEAVNSSRFLKVHYLAVVLNIPLTEQVVQACLLSNIPIFPEENPLSTKILLLKAGCHIDPESFYALSNDDTNLQPSAASMYIDDYLSHPRSLADMCCFRIRRVLGKSLPGSVDCLPLPKKLIDFVKLTHVDSVEYYDCWDANCHNWRELLL